MPNGHCHRRESGHSSDFSEGLYREGICASVFDNRVEAFEDVQMTRFTVHPINHCGGG